MVGVCIKYFHENYGGMLQAYATISLLEEKGIEYELIRYQKERTPVEIIKSIPRLFNGVLINDKYETYIKKKGLTKHPDFAKNNSIRENAFKEFNEKHFTKLAPISVGYKELCKNANRYSAVITGSDQLWSPAGLPTNYYNLMFVPENILKISIASSFGVKEIPWYQKKRTKNFLNRIEYISMRENRGSEIVKELTGRIVPTILDPVFFLSKEEWLKRIPNKREIQEPYIFAYFLGTSKEHRLAVMKLSQLTSLKIVTIRHMDQYVEEDENFGNIAPYDVAPDRFLNLLRNAEYVCTDSFHGTAFSIINEKQFIVFNRYDENSSFSKNSRIDSLCTNFDLEKRRYKKGFNIKNFIKNNIDYVSVNKKYLEQKKITDDYLNKVLNEIRCRS